MLERRTYLLVSIQCVFFVFPSEQVGTEYFVHVSKVSPKVCSERGTNKHSYQQGILRIAIPHPSLPWWKSRSSKINTCFAWQYRQLILEDYFLVVLNYWVNRNAAGLFALFSVFSLPCDCGFVTLETSIGWSTIGCAVTLQTVNQRCMDAYETTNRKWEAI